MFKQNVIPFQWYHWFSSIVKGSLTVMGKRNSKNRKSSIFISGGGILVLVVPDIMYYIEGSAYLTFRRYIGRYVMSGSGVCLPLNVCMYQSQNRKGCEILPSCVFYFNYLLLLICKESDIIVKCQAHETIIMMQLYSGVGIPRCPTEHNALYNA